MVDDQRPGHLCDAEAMDQAIELPQPLDILQILHCTQDEATLERPPIG